MRRIALALVGAAMLLAAPAAARPGSLHYFGVGHGPLVGDGRHELALPSTHGAVQVFVYANGTARITQLPQPMCASDLSGSPVFTFPATLGALHEDKLAWTCSVPANLVLEDVSSGQALSVVRPNTITDASGGPDVFTHQYADLDDPGLTRRLCAPLVRSENVDDTYGDVPQFQPYFYEPHYGATVVLSGTARTGTLVLERCGSRRKEVLDRCPGGCSSVQLSAGVLTWLSGKKVRAYVPRTRRFYSWRTPATPDQRWNMGLLHLRDRLLVSIPPHAGGSDWTYWFSPLPKKR